MSLIVKGMRLTAYTHKYRIPLVEPPHHGLIKSIDPWFQKLLIHILVPSFIKLVHLEEAILVWHLSMGKTKRTENIIKSVARHDAIDYKWSTFSHRWCRRGPPVPKNLNSKPECHVDPTTNLLYKLLNIHWHTQTFVGLGIEDLLKIVPWENSQKQMKQWHTKDGAMQITSEISERILKVAGFPRANNTLSPPITGASISLTLSKNILWCCIVIIINIDPLATNLRHVFRMYIRCTTC